MFEHKNEDPISIRSLSKILILPTESALQDPLTQSTLPIPLMMNINVNKSFNLSYPSIMAIIRAKRADGKNVVVENCLVNWTCQKFLLFI
jgi:hypothetical protein